MTIRLVPGDICEFSGDAVVNPANNQGLGGGGADGAIHKAAGPGLRAACENLPTFPDLKGYAPGLKDAGAVRVPNGSAVPTPAFDLPCRWVIHTAGPVWPTDRRPDAADRAELRACFKMPMLTAVGMGLSSIAYPAISAGVYGCPPKTCAEVALKFADDYSPWPIDITFYLYPASNLTIWTEVATELGIAVEVGFDE